MTELYPRKEPKELPAITLAYLGPNGNFTHMAALEYRQTKENVQLVKVESLPKIFEMVNQNLINRAIVPIDNSSDGHIKDTLQALQGLDIQIIHELVIPVSLSLVMRKEAQPTEVWSKDTALRQARRFLDKNYPQLKRVEHKSTGDAIWQASKNPNIAAIGSRISAREQGIPQDTLTQQDGIEDNPANATRFVVITKDKELTPPTENAKTSFIMNVPHQPSKLFLCLSILKSRGINLSQIKSFNEEYGKASFIVTISGHQWEENVYQALNDLRQQTSLKMLGSYKKADYKPPETDEQLSITDDDIVNLKRDLFHEKPRETNETVIAFSLRDRIGALSDVLEIFQRINLTRIGSSPSTRGKLDEYVFYLGFNNNLPSEKKSQLMGLLTSQCLQIAILK